MEALLTAIALWLSINFQLPANLNHPAIKFVSAAEMIEPLKKTSCGRATFQCLKSVGILSLYTATNQKRFSCWMDGQARHLLSYPFLCMKWSTICKMSGN